MTIHTTRHIDKIMKDKANDYASFVGGTVEPMLNGYCVETEKELVIFSAKNVGWDYEYIMEYVIEVKISVYHDDFTVENVEFTL